MSYDPFQALYSGTGGVLSLLLTTIESTYPTVCVCLCLCLCVCECESCVKDGVCVCESCVKDGV